MQTFICLPPLLICLTYLHIHRIKQAIKFSKSEYEEKEATSIYRQDQIHINCLYLFIYLFWLFFTVFTLSTTCFIVDLVFYS